MATQNAVCRRLLCGHSDSREAAERSAKRWRDTFWLDNYRG